jgi:MoxR-like ATPase
LQQPIDLLQPVATAADISDAQAAVRKVHVAESLRGYIVELARRTREQAEVYLGASPRGSLALFRASQALASIRGRNYVTPDDIQALAKACLCHRIILGSAARLQEINQEDIVHTLLEKVPVPAADIEALQAA